MQMTETGLSQLARKLLEALNDAGGEWLTRNEIAEKIGRRGRLNPYDTQLLDQLVSDGLAEMDNRLLAAVKTERIYRITAAGKQQVN